MNDQEERQSQKFLFRGLGLAFELAVSIFVGLGLGLALDRWLDIQPVGMFLGILLGSLVALKVLWTTTKSTRE